MALRWRRRIRIRSRAAGKAVEESTVSASSSTISAFWTRNRMAAGRQVRLVRDGSGVEELAGEGVAEAPAGAFEAGGSGAVSGAADERAVGGDLGRRGR